MHNDQLSKEYRQTLQRVEDCSNVIMVLGLIICIALVLFFLIYQIEKYKSSN